MLCVHATLLIAKNDALAGYYDYLLSLVALLNAPGSTPGGEIERWRFQYFGRGFLCSILLLLFSACGTRVCIRCTICVRPRGYHCNVTSKGRKDTYDQHEERILSNPDSTHQLSDQMNRQPKNIFFEACPETMQEVKEIHGYEND